MGRKQVMSGKDVRKLIEQHGWRLDSVKGSHHHFKHPKITGKITIPIHGKDDLHPKILQGILRRLGIKP